ncbi:hypothetical protein GCM10023172_31910 [Hymenobacter ginsengisoli]|uniref:Uncharacterized protein n=1 Tax=Hymenobacter ginsengisoli TaxID=1051626 RepID=A0ABP8QKB2_9BACT|nr:MULTISPECIES: hypothetical protein [unclassified Hymenobacter]MBO2031271.1 hypothetical protein [Hymenobacter sp. BT559]
MKKLLFTLALATASLGATAQTAPAAAPAAATPPGYTEQLGATIGQVMHTGDAAELQALAAKLERAAAVAPADWLPRYYQAYALVISTFTGKEAAPVKDKALDRAEAALAQALRLKGDESELLTLQAYLYQARLSIEPAVRAQEYSAKVTEAVDRAEALNPANPRPYLVEANNVYYTPVAFGGGAATARPLYEQAKARFAAFRPASPLAPTWGQEQLLGRLKQYEAPTAAK